MRNVGGIAQNEAQKSSDMFMKTQYLDRETVLREKVISTVNRSQNGGTEFITLPPKSDTTISMSFSETTSNSIEKCIITQKGQTHTVNVGAEFGFSAGESGGWGGKVSASYGFSYSTLKSIAENTVSSISKTKSNTTEIKVSNSGNTVTEYTDKGGQSEKTTSGSDAKVKTFAIIYETSIIEVTRKREGASEITERTDTINLGRRVRAVLPLTDKADGTQVYISARGVEFQKNNLWAALN
jgi:hypothetical protein